MKGSDLKDWRETIGITQSDLATKLGVAPNTISRWELGERSIPEFLELALETVTNRMRKGDEGEVQEL